MKVLQIENELREEHMQMYFGSREEFKIELPFESEIVDDVIAHINQKLNDDLETETLLMENTEIDRNLYSFLRTFDVIEEGMSFRTFFQDDHPARELILDDAAKKMVTRFRLVQIPVKDMEVYALTPYTDVLQHGVVYYDLDVLNQYVFNIVTFLCNHGFARVTDFKN
jgi:hypothetical protein